MSCENIEPFIMMIKRAHAQTVECTPYFGIVLNSILLPFLVMIALFPGFKSDCTNSITNYPYSRAAITFALVSFYCLQCYLFRYLLSALFNKNNERLNNWIKMNVVAVALLCTTIVCLAFLANDSCNLPFIISMNILTIFYIFSIFIVKMHRPVISDGTSPSPEESTASCV